MLKTICVNDRMQWGYTDTLFQPTGRNFAADLRRNERLLKC